MKALLPIIAKPFVENELSDNIEAAWFSNADEAKERIADAQVAWVDMHDKHAMRSVIEAGTRLDWLYTLYSGIDHLPIDQLAKQGAVVTNGSGLGAVAVSEYAVLGMLAFEKRFDEVVRLADRKEWPKAPPAYGTLDGQTAMVLGQGPIGGSISDKLQAFGMKVIRVARTPRPEQGILGESDWKRMLGTVDWLVVALPSTSATEEIIGREEIAALGERAKIANVARGECIDQQALIEALSSKALGGAFLDTVTPEPLPSDHPLWDAPNLLMSMHLSGETQSGLFRRAAGSFLENLVCLQKTGQPLQKVSLSDGY